MLYSLNGHSPKVYAISNPWALEPCVVVDRWKVEGWSEGLKDRPLLAHQSTWSIKESLLPPWGIQYAKPYIWYETLYTFGAFEYGGGVVHIHSGATCLYFLLNSFFVASSSLSIIAGKWSVVGSIRRRVRSLGAL